MNNDDLDPQAFVPPKMPEERPGQTGGKRHQNRLARTRALCEAALGRFLALGLDAVTIDDVVQAAGMSKGSFYRYFDNKEDLVSTLFGPVSEAVGHALQRCSQALEEADDASALFAAYLQMANDLLAVLMQQPDVVRLFLQERHGPPTPPREPILTLNNEIIDLSLRMTEAARKRGLLRPVNPEVSAVAVVGAVHELLWRQFQGHGPPDPVSGAQELIDIVLHGVTPA